MGKRIYTVLIVLIALLGLSLMIYFGVQPRPKSITSITQFRDQADLTKNLLQTLREEIKQSPILFLGLDPERTEHFQIWREFLDQNQESGLRYEVLVIERDLSTELFPEALRIASKDQFSVLASEIAKAREQNQRVAVILPLTFAVQMVEKNLAEHFNAKVQFPATSLSLTDFARRHENEKEMRIRCNVEGVDQTGLGALGCMIAQASRANYRKRFAIGEPIGFIQQIGLRDYMIFYTREN